MNFLAHGYHRLGLAQLDNQWWGWHLTAGHARDWLSLHFASREPWEGMTAFVDKRPVDYRALRARARDGEATESVWGPPTGTCPACGARGLPEEMAFCGHCGQKL